MTETPKKKRDPKVIIFGLIGVFNTLFDYVLYAVIQYFTGSILIANVGATSAAMVGSYILNSKLTFKTRKWTVKSFILFIIVTLFGLWVLQTAAIYLITYLTNIIPDFLWQLFGPLEHVAKILAPKILATPVTLIWNFVWYNKVIFKDKDAQDPLRALD